MRRKLWRIFRCRVRGKERIVSKIRGWRGTCQEEEEVDEKVEGVAVRVDARR